MIVAWRGVVLIVLVACLAACDRRDPIAGVEDRRLPRSQLLVDALERGENESRRRAALAMGRIQSVEYVPALSVASAYEESTVRRAAIFALGQLGLAEGIVIPPVAREACVAALNHAEVETVAAAVEALGKLGPPGAERHLIPLLLDHPADRVRAAAALGLFRLRFVPLWRKQADRPPPLSGAAVEALIDAMSDPALEVRRAAVYAVSRYGEPAALPALVDRLEERDAWTRLFAVRALGKSSDAADVATHDALEPLLADPSVAVRVETLLALTALGQPDRVPLALAQEESAQLRRLTALALAEAEGESTLNVLHSLNGDRSPWVRSAALSSLSRRLGEAYDPHLERELSDPAWIVRAAAAAALAASPTSSGELLQRAYRDPDARVGAALVEALGDRPESDAILDLALASSDLALRGSALSILAARQSAGLIERLIEVYDRSEGVAWIELRESIVDALEARTESTGQLRRILRSDPAASVRSRSAAALRRRGAEFAERERPRSEASQLLRTRFSSDPIVLLETTRGKLRIRCLASEAPVHVANFVRLVREGFYDGLSWHRVVPNFVIQGGDPRGDGWGSAGYSIRDEINQLRFERGSVGMPKAGKDTGGCQLFITQLPTPHLDGNYTVFGRVIGGLELLDRIEVGDRIIRAYLEPASLPTAESDQRP